MKKLLILLITIFAIFSITGCDTPKQLVKNDTDKFIGTWYNFHKNSFDKMTIEKDEKGNLWFSYKQKAIKYNDYSQLYAYIDEGEQYYDTREKIKVQKTEDPLTINVEGNKNFTFDKKTNTLIRQRKHEPDRVFKPINELTEAEKVEWKNAEIKEIEDLFRARGKGKCEDRIDLSQIK